jgi:hypothetical protein
MRVDYLGVDLDNIVVVVVGPILDLDSFVVVVVVPLDLDSFVVVVVVVAVPLIDFDSIIVAVFVVVRTTFVDIIDSVEFAVAVFEMVLIVVHRDL